VSCDSLVLERLAAVDEIRAVIARYAIAFDDHDWSAFRELWADDAVFVADGVVFAGRDHLVDFIASCLPADYFGKHVNSPSLIEVAADLTTATAKTDVIWVTQNFETTIVARYYDVFVKRGGRWLILRREESGIEFKPGAPPISEAAAAVTKGMR
jgi:uncharacterized protein (TIGR02246 family)